MSKLLPDPITAYSFRLGRNVQYEHSFHMGENLVNRFSLINTADEPNEDHMTLADYAKRDQRRSQGVAAMTWNGNHH